MKNAKYLLMAILAMGVSSAMAQVSFEGNEKPVYVEGNYTRHRECRCITQPALTPTM